MTRHLNPEDAPCRLAYVLPLKASTEPGITQLLSRNDRSRQNLPFGPMLVNDCNHPEAVACQYSESQQYCLSAAG